MDLPRATQTSSSTGSESGEVGVLLYRATSLSVWENPPSHDQTTYNTIMMVALDSYNHGHNALALRNCNISVVCDLFLVLLRLGLVRTPEVLSASFLHSNQGPTFRPEPCKREFYPSSIHSSYKFAHHVPPTYKSCRITVTEFVYTSVTNGSCL